LGRENLFSQAAVERRIRPAEQTRNGAGLETQHRSSSADGEPSFWSKLPVSLRAIISGILIALIAANVWPALVLILGGPIAAIAEIIFLAGYLWWCAGGGFPRTTQPRRAAAFRRGTLSPEQWAWSLAAALFFAVTVHASIVLLFRLEPYPVAAFRQGYDLSLVPGLPLKWLAVVIAAASAGICEETGFRGYMQRPIELRHGPRVAILVSSLLFCVIHLTKAWALVGMVPIVFGAGVLLGLLAWSSQSLIPNIVGHTVMDIGLFAYWWSGIAGTFHARPISETGVDRLFVLACLVFAVSLLIVLLALSRLRKIASANALPRCSTGAGVSGR
jgi:membrane protease YdiL (CAAX protease family)